MNKVVELNWIELNHINRRPQAYDYLQVLEDKTLIHEHFLKDYEASYKKINKYETVTICCNELTFIFDLYTCTKGKYASLISQYKHKLNPE